MYCEIEAIKVVMNSNLSDNSPCKTYRFLLYSQVESIKFAKILNYQFLKDLCFGMSWLRFGKFWPMSFSSGYMLHKNCGRWTQELSPRWNFIFNRPWHKLLLIRFSCESSKRLTVFFTMYVIAISQNLWYATASNIICKMFF